MDFDRINSSSLASTSAATGVHNNRRNNRGSGHRSMVVTTSVDRETEISFHSYLSVDWTAEEAAIVEELLVKYDKDELVMCCAKIARQLKGKTISDVMHFVGNKKRRSEFQSKAKNATLR